MIEKDDVFIKQKYVNVDSFQNELKQTFVRDFRNEKLTFKNKNSKRYIIIIFFMAFHFNVTNTQRNHQRTTYHKNNHEIQWV